MSISHVDSADYSAHHSNYYNGGEEVPSVEHEERLYEARSAQYNSDYAPDDIPRDVNTGYRFPDRAPAFTRREVGKRGRTDTSVAGQVSEYSHDDEL